MRTPVAPLELYEPRSLRDALHALRTRAPFVPIAGGTDVYVGLNFGTFRQPAFPDVQPAFFLNLWNLDELRGIDIRGNLLRIGALSTYTDLIGSRLVAERLPILAAAAREIGAVQIQNRGTLGGNIANGSPAGDTLPVLAVAEATVVLRSADRTRRVPFTSFYTGYRASVAQPDELIVAVEVPRIEGRQWFRKVGTRRAQAISKVVMAGVRGVAPRIAFGSVAPTVVRATRTEAALASGASLDVAARTLQDDICPIDDFRSTAAYRRRVAANLLAAFWRETAHDHPPLA
jgi:xanthine dehydrogenase small subunit